MVPRDEEDIEDSSWEEDDEEFEEEEDDSASEESTELDELIEESELLIEENEFHRALKLWRRSIDRYADDPRAFYHHALTIFRLLEVELDEHVAIDANPEQIALFEEALGSLEETVATEPSYYKAFNLMGAMHALRDNLPAAIEAWEKSLAIKPDQKQVAEDLEVARDKIG